MPRLRQVRKSEVSSPRVREAFDAHFGTRDPVIEQGPPSEPPGHWWTVLALDPDLLELILDRQAWQFSQERELAPDLRELAIMRTGWVVGSRFVYAQHAKLLQRLGVSRDKVVAIQVGAADSCWSPIERVVLTYTDDVVRGWGRVSDDVFSSLQAKLTDRAILELTFLVTTYLQSSLLCRALRLEYDDHPDELESVIEAITW